MKTSPNLIWLDLEMTGLNPKKDKILEIAAIVTDSDLNILDESTDLVIHRSKQVLNKMTVKLRKIHRKSGLYDKVLESKTTKKEAGLLLRKVINKYCDKKSGLLCGSAIYVDRMFIAAEFPSIDKLLHYRVIDVSSVRELVRRWCPEVIKDLLDKYNSHAVHRSLEDIKWSINELKFYREKIFKKT